MQRIQFLIAFTGIFAFGLISCGDRDEYTRWDQNGDGLLDNNEFNASLDDEREFDEWDEDRNGVLEEKEFGAGYSKEYDEMGPDYATYDRNRDGGMDRDEFNYGRFNDYDRDRDGYLSREEYEEFDD